MAPIYTLLGVPYVAALDPVRGIVLRKAARKRVPSPGQMSLFGSNDPKEGDTKVENGVTYRLNQHSRWERTDKAKGKAKAKPKAVVPVVEDKAEVKSKPSGIVNMRQGGDTGSRRDETPAMQTQQKTRKPSAKQQAEQQLEDLKAENQAIRASVGPEFWLKDENFQKANFADFGISEEEMSTPEGIDKAYKRLARIVHPDMGGSEDQMANLSELRKQMKMMAKYGDAKALKPRPSTLAQINQRITDMQAENRQLQEMVDRAKKPQAEPEAMPVEAVVDQPKPKGRLGDRMRAIAQELRQETEAQKQYTARMLGAAAQLAQNQDNLIDEVVDMVNEDLDQPEALPEPTIGDMLAEQKAQEEGGGDWQARLDQLKQLGENPNIDAGSDSTSQEIELPNVSKKMKDIEGALLQGFLGTNEDQSPVSKNPYYLSSSYGDAWQFGRFLAQNNMGGVDVDRNRNTFKAGGKYFKVDGDTVKQIKA